MELLLDYGPEFPIQHSAQVTFRVALFVGDVVAAAAASAERTIWRVVLKTFGLRQDASSAKRAFRHAIATRRWLGSIDALVLSSNPSRLNLPHAKYNYIG